LRLIVGLSLYVAANVGGLILSSLALRGSGHVGVRDVPDLLKRPEVLVGGGLYVLSFALWLYLLSLDEVSVVYPLAIGCAYTGSVVCSIVVLDESISSLKIAGLLLVGLGIMLVTVSR